jgi:hypothetical protein
MPEERSILRISVAYQSFHVRRMSVCVGVESLLSRNDLGSAIGKSWQGNPIRDHRLDMWTTITGVSKRLVPLMERAIASPHVPSLAFNFWRNCGIPTLTSQSIAKSCSLFLVFRKTFLNRGLTLFWLHVFINATISSIGNTS